jgi:hypothetical protein
LAPQKISIKLGQIEGLIAYELGASAWASPKPCMGKDEMENTLYNISTLNILF